MSKRLTARTVETAKPGARRYELSDAGSGLRLVVQPGGHKSYITRTRLDGVPIKVTHQVAGLAEARVLNAEAIKQAKQGIDPRAAKRLAKAERRVAEADTLEAVGLLYLDSDKTKRLRSVSQVRDKLERLVFPRLGHVPVADIRRSQITALLDHIERTSGPVSADRTLSAISCVLKFYARRADDYVPPLASGMSRTSAKERARDRTFTDDEVRRLWATGNPFVRFALLTCARRSEISGMRWSEVDGSDWRLPAARNKSKVDLVRPLSKAAMAVLVAQPRDSDFVFGNSQGRPFRSYAWLKSRMQAATGIRDFRLHDARRTGRSLLSRAGASSDVSEMILGHALPAIRSIYDRHDFHREKARALEMLAAQLRAITDPPKGNNVRQLRRA